ncbi:MAG: hypothetical protein WA973_00895 [Mesorhizobium sp.]
MRFTRAAARLAPALLVLAAVSAVNAKDIASKNRASPGAEVVIRDDSGGYVAGYAMRAAQLKRSETHVRFAGRCDSACTLYLGLPKSSLCVERGAYFRFHRPSANSAATVSEATRFMMQNYPSWVRQWIADSGGLTTSLKTMDFSYASRYLPLCTDI